MSDLGDPTPITDLNPEYLPFPNNVLVLLAQELQAIDYAELVAMRPLKPEDPPVSIGVFVIDWIPGDAEMTGRANSDPTISTYLFGIQALIRHTDREEGLLKHALLSKIIRSMLYRRESIRVRLSQLNEASLGITERTQRWGVRQQRFLSNELEGNFLYLSTLEFWVETETT